MASMTNSDPNQPSPEARGPLTDDTARTDDAVRTVPADAIDALAATDRTDPADAAGKPLYAEQDLSQVSLNKQDLGRTDARPAVTGPVSDGVSDKLQRGASSTTVYSPGAGEVRVVENRSDTEPERSYAYAADREEGGVLDSLKETLLSRTEGLRQRGEQLAHTAKLKMEVMQYSRDLESLYARLGRAYHKRSDVEILNLIEQEIRQVEADIALRERQLGSQEVNHELRAQRLKAERERQSLKLPELTEEGLGSSFAVEERPPRIAHYMDTEKRDTFFGLDKGGVNQQATVAGGNAAFDTQIEPEDSVVSLEDLEKADNR